MKKKQGISLIVLVITIIVIVVLATAVILSIANNNPIENAKKAVSANEEATLKEEATLLYSDWYTKKKLNENDLVNAEDYVKGKLSGKYSQDLIDRLTVTDEGEISILPDGTLRYWSESADISWYNENDTELYIATAEELAGIAKLVNEETDNFEGKTINLTKDIDLRGKEWTPIGNSAENYFNGEFYGNGHKISNMKITESNLLHIGLFGYVVSAVIDGVIIEKSTIFSSNARDIGGIVGLAESETYNNTTIRSEVRHCASKNNKIEGTGTIGGIVGDLIDSEVVSCYNTSHVENLSTDSKANWSSVSDSGDRAGGIVGGCIDVGYIYNCYNAGKVVATHTRAGGIVGACNLYTLINCYNVGEVTGESSGEIIAVGEGCIDIKNCYCLDSDTAVSEDYVYDEECSYEVTTIPESGLKAADLNKNEYNDFKQDTNNINGGYPILSWQK